jgi:hypothetical protein
LWAKHFHNLYVDFASFLQSELSKRAELSTDAAEGLSTTEQALIAAGSYTAAKQVAENIVAGWQIPVTGIKTLVGGTTSALHNLIHSAADDYETLAVLGDGEVEDWSNERIGYLLATTEKSMRAELTRAVADELERGGTAKEIANRLRDRTDGFPQYKADRVARTEAETAYNVGTIFAGRSLGHNAFRAHDASDGEDTSTDEECLDRDDTVFTAAQALIENEDEHPNGTLYFTIEQQERAENPLK